MYLKVTEAAEEFVATQKIAAETVNWNSTKAVRAWNKLREAVEEHNKECVHHVPLSDVKGGE